MIEEAIKIREWKAAILFRQPGDPVLIFSVYAGYVEAGNRLHCADVRLRDIPAADEAYMHDFRVIVIPNPRTLPVRNPYCYERLWI